MRGSVPALTVVFALAGCGESVRGDRPPVADAGPADIVLRPIEGCPSRNGARGRWETLEVPAEYSGRSNAALVSTGDGVIVFGGNSNGASGYAQDHWHFHGSERRWRALPSGAPVVDFGERIAVWIPGRREVLVWNSRTRTGSRSTLEGPWPEIATTNAPRTYIQRVVLVDGVVFFGGSTTDGDHDEFSIYDPESDRWRPVLAPREQTTRTSYAMVAHGESEVLVWGGADGTTGTGVPRNDGWRYDVRRGRWSSVSRLDAPAPRWRAEATSSGALAIVYAGTNGARSLRTGGRYSSVHDVWLPMSLDGAPGPIDPTGSYLLSQAWTGSDLFVWAAWVSGTEPQSAAARYDPHADRWSGVDPPPSPATRESSTMRWVDCGLYLVGGRVSVRDRVEHSREVLRWSP